MDFKRSLLTLGLNNLSLGLEHFLSSALGIRKRLWGGSHRRTLKNGAYLAATYYRQGRSDDADAGQIRSRAPE